MSSSPEWVIFARGAASTLTAREAKDAERMLLQAEQHGRALSRCHSGE